jgi:hypothetical protein
MSVPSQRPGIRRGHGKLKAWHPTAGISPQTVKVLCSGTCKNGSSVSEVGEGETPAEAQAKADSQIVDDCALMGSDISSFDQCIFL